MSAEGFISERVQFARLYVSLDLPIPFGCVEFGEPPPEFREFPGGEGGDFLFQRLEFAHAQRKYHRMLAPASRRRWSDDF
jgi:hypothetical protein